MRNSITEEDCFNPIFELIDEMSNSEDIREKARINLEETCEDIFPYKEYDVHILSDDLEPLHLHIVKDDWNVSFLIKTGDLHKIYSQGQDVHIYEYMVNNVKPWLDARFKLIPKITNRENAALMWLQLH